jgi:phosphonate transport system substrate-binding protein
LFFASLASPAAHPFWRGLAEFLGCRMLEDVAWQEAEQRLHSGAAGIGTVCGLQYVLAADRLALLAAPVMASPRYSGAPVYFSDVVVRASSGLERFEDLRGARFAYNEPTSHSGYSVVRYTLAVRFGTAAFFGVEIESGSHLDSLRLLLAGDIDAAAIDSTVLEQVLLDQPSLAAQLRGIDSLGPSPIPPVVASPSLPAAAHAAVRAALLSMHLDPTGQAVLATGHVSHFVHVSDADYNPIRHMAALGNQVGRVLLSTKVSAI